MQDTCISKAKLAGFYLEKFLRTRILHNAFLLMNTPELAIQIRTKQVIRPYLL